MKKLFGKALAMAVMMSVFAGQAYARDGEIYTQNGDSSNDPYLNVQYDYGYDKEIIRTQILADEIRFIELRAEASANTYVSGYLNTKKLYLRDPNTEKTITLNTDTGLTLNSDKSQGIHNLADGVALYDAVNMRQMYTELAKKADASDLATKADAATTLAGYGITDGATKTELEGKADKATTLAGYGITDGATKTELEGKADKATTLAGYGITDGATKTELDAETTARKDADADLQKQIDAISGGSSAGLNELNNKINQTDARVDRVGATAAALAAINYQPMAKGQSQVAIGMGGYNGKKATAIGLAYQFDNRISGSVAGAANGSEHMFNVGFNYLFGQHTAKDVAPMAASNSVTLKEAELQAQVDSMKNEIAELKAMVKALAAK